MLKGSFGVLFSLLSLFGCKKSEIPFYDAKHDAVRFAWREDENNKEEKGFDKDMGLFKASYSFVATPTAESHTYELPIELIGRVMDKERKVSYQVDDKATTAPSDSYEILGGIIPAGKRSGKLKIKLKNPEELKSKEYVLYVVLTKSEDLAAGPSLATRAELLWTRRILPPQYEGHYQTYNALIASEEQWNSKSTDYFSASALQVIVDALGWTDWDDLKKHGSKGNGSRYGNYKYLPLLNSIESGNFYRGYALALASYIKKYNEKNPDKPLIHDGGKLEGQPIKVRTY